jgi:hypothetical protein
LFRGSLKDRNLLSPTGHAHVGRFFESRLELLFTVQ